MIDGVLHLCNRQLHLLMIVVLYRKHHAGFTPGWPVANFRTLDVKTYASHDHAALILRVSLGLLMLAHGFYLKLFVFGADGTLGFFASLGLPASVAWLTIAGETLGGLGLIFGVLTRWASLLLIPIALGATWVHAGNGWVFSNAGGGWEFPLFLVVALGVQALLGDGAHALGPRLKAFFASSPQPART